MVTITPIRHQRKPWLHKSTHTKPWMICVHPKTTHLYQFERQTYGSLRPTIQMYYEFYNIFSETRRQYFSNRNQMEKYGYYWPGTKSTISLLSLTQKNVHPGPKMMQSSVWEANTFLHIGLLASVWLLTNGRLPINPGASITLWHENLC